MMGSRALRLTSSAPAVETATSAAAPRIFLNAVVERSFFVLPPEPRWRTEWEERAERWRAAYRQEYPKEFTAKLDPREAPRASYLAAVERVLAEHADTPNPHDDDLHSFKRKLDRRLYLLANVGSAWSFPRLEFAPPADGSVTMRSALLALCRAQLGKQLKVLHLSRAPIAHQLAPDGSAVDFYFKLKHMVGNVQQEPPQPGAEALKADAFVRWGDYAWFTRDEAVERLGQPVRSLSERMLLD
jgi:hypothetical protein